MNYDDYNNNQSSTYKAADSYVNYSGVRNAGNAESGSEASASGYSEERKYSRSEVIVLKKSTVSIIALIAVVALLAASIGGGLFVSGMNSFGIFGKNTPVQTNDFVITPTSELSTTEAVAKKVLNSVVGVTTSNKTSGMLGDGYQPTGQGTGIIVHSDGYILTNSHVISDGQAGKIEVLLADGKSVEAKPLWYDAAIDLAIIKVDLAGLTPVEIGDSDNVQIGAYVAAIGNPLGLEFNGSVTQGIVSGLNRSIVASSGTKTSRMEGLIQVDAAINPGNSGGPLLNSKGEVIGVNTAKASAEGMGFAIPINTAAPIIDKVIATGSFQRAYIGVTTMNAAEVAEEYPEMQLEANAGAFIQEVTVGSPAAKAGLKMKDVITKVNGKKITTSTSLIKELLNYSAGETIEITYIRDGKEDTASVTLATQSDVYGEGQTTPNDEKGEDLPGQLPEDDYWDGFSEDDYWEYFFGR